MRAPAWSADLVAVAAATGATALAVALDAPTWLRAPLGLAFVLFLPGYALLAATFVETRATAGAGATEEARLSGGLDGVERVALAFGASIVLVASSVLALGFTPLGIATGPVVGLVSAITLGAAGVAAARRARSPAPAVGGARETRGPLDRAANAGVATAIVLASIAVALALPSPLPSTGYTEFYVLGPGGDAAGYPVNLTVGEVGTVVLGVENREGTSRDFRVETRVLAVAEGVGDRLLASSNDTFALSPGGSRLALATFSAPEAGTLRAEWRLFADGSPTPVRALHLWVRAG